MASFRRFGVSGLLLTVLSLAAILCIEAVCLRVLGIEEAHRAFGERYFLFSTYLLWMSVILIVFNIKAYGRQPDRFLPMVLTADIIVPVCLSVLFLGCEKILCLCISHDLSLVDVFAKVVEEFRPTCKEQWFEWMMIVSVFINIPLWFTYGTVRFRKAKVLKILLLFYLVFGLFLIPVITTALLLVGIGHPRAAHQDTAGS